MTHRGAVVSYADMRLYFVRHAESEANAAEVLASRMDFPLSARGRADAEALAAEFCPRTPRLTRIMASPLPRAQQTAAPFARLTGLQVAIDDRITEQHLGRYSGMSYDRIKSEPGYVHDRTRRWDWVPEGGGESYQMISERVEAFLRDLTPAPADGETLIVTHAVTMRLIHAVLARTLPSYPERIASNGEIWSVEFQKVGERHEVEAVDLAALQTIPAHRA